MYENDEKNIEMTDLFNDGGVVKTILRASAENVRPQVGQEIAISYTRTDADDAGTHNLVYIVGTSSSNLFIPLRTMDKIVCSMNRGEKCSVRIESQYSGSSGMNLEMTLVHIQHSGGNPLGGVPSSLSQYQDHLLQNPDVMEQMLSSPFMQSLLSDPEVMGSMMNNNPQMQQLMEQNPELRNMMNDPEFIQQSMEAMRNPAMMREMMRNTDRAMSNIESMPGGSAALHKLYNEIQAPLYEAASDIDGGALKNTKVADSKQLKAKYGEMMAPKKPVTEPMRNPWAPQQPSLPQLVSPVVNAPTTTGRGNNMFDMSSMAQMMQDPGMQQMMSTMFAGQNSHQSSADPFADPNFVRQLFNPSTIQAMSNLERGIGHSGNVQNAFGNFLLAQSDNPEERYRTQLATLRSMGFEDTEAAIRALERTGGNVDQAVQVLIAEMESNPS